MDHKPKLLDQLSLISTVTARFLGLHTY
ncbi:hypothetical protein AYI69_g9424, partial [Smittium culicis]